MSSNGSARSCFSPSDTECSTSRIDGACGRYAEIASTQWTQSTLPSSLQIQGWLNSRPPDQYSLGPQSIRRNAGVMRRSVDCEPINTMNRYRRSGGPGWWMKKAIQYGEQSTAKGSSTPESQHLDARAGGPGGVGAGELSEHCGSVDQGHGHHDACDPDTGGLRAPDARKGDAE